MNIGLWSGYGLSTEQIAEVLERDVGKKMIAIWLAVFADREKRIG